MDGKTIEGQIVSKDKAAAKYEDALGSGNTGFMMGEISKDDRKYLELCVGNIPVGKAAKISTQFSQIVGIKEGSYHFIGLFP